MNTIDASIGNVITSQQVAELPSLFRDDAGSLLGLQPGVQVTGGDSQNGSVTGSRADTTTRHARRTRCQRRNHRRRFPHRGQGSHLIPFQKFGRSSETPMSASAVVRVLR